MKKYCLFVLLLLVTSTIGAQYLVKFSPTQVVLNNEIGLAFEHRIRSKIASEVQVGTTFSKSIVPFESLFEKKYIGGADLNNAWGVYAGLSLRYYFYKYNVAPAGFYLGTLYKYRLMNTKYEDPQGALKSSTLGNNQVVLQLLVGYQFPFTSLFSMDFYIGAGANIQMQNAYRIVESEGARFGQTYKNNHTTFAPTIGVKVGFGKSGKELL